jgi:energy-coupling factor transport system permease protein
VTPRDLHPGAWWIWALGLATAASATTNPFVLVLVVTAAVAVVVARRTEAPWALSFRLYVYLALLIITIRVVFRVVFGGVDEGRVLFRLPEIPLPDVAAGIALLGPVTQADLLGGLYDGMRLAAIVLCIGAANTLANPRRLLASLPPALYELGTAVVVALSVFPQLAESVGRVRRARHLRGDPGRGVGALKRIVIPVMEDALDRSMSLAASMDARGYGRVGTATRADRRLTGALMVAGLIGLCVGVYALLDRTAPRWLVAPFLVGGVVVAAAGLLAAGRRVQRTRYRPDRWKAAELVAVACGVITAALVLTADVGLAYPFYDELPRLSVPLLAAIVVAVAPAVLTPPPVLEPGSVS